MSQRIPIESQRIAMGSLRRQYTGDVIEQRIDRDFFRDEVLTHAIIDDDLQCRPAGLDPEAKGGSMDIYGRTQERNDQQERLSMITALAMVAATLITVVGSLLIA